MTANQALLARRQAVVPRGVSQMTLATAAAASGALITDANGNELIDFAGGIGVMNAGHCMQPVVDAIQEQAARLLHACFQVATYEPYLDLCEKLAALLPHGDVTKVLLVNSGAEAVENAVKIARQATGRGAVLCYTEAFHGRTHLAMSLTSKVTTKAGCGPFAAEVYRVPFPRARAGEDRDAETLAVRELARLRAMFSHTVRAEDVAAIIIEPVQGEGGFVPAPAAYLAGLRSLCDELGIVLIFDEVQTGFCRTGRWGAYQRYGVVPDLSTWGKSMGGGLPIAAVVGRREVMDAAKPGTIGGTYGGNPVACASALATIRLMEELDLNGRAERLGARIRQRFDRLKERCEAVVEVRGLGAMLAIELVEPDGRPATQLADGVVRACLARGVLLLTAGPYANVIRVLSPLVITDEELERGLDTLEEEVLRLATRHRLVDLAAV